METQPEHPPLKFTGLCGDDECFVSITDTALVFKVNRGENDAESFARVIRGVAFCLSFF